jgi:AcrR family transcriptional regulator
MPRTPEQFQEMRDATNAKIQQAATKLFARQGFPATSVQDIAAEAGISKGLLYNHYDSKDALFASILNNTASGLRSTAEVFRSDASPQELIEAIAAELPDGMTSGQNFANLTILITRALLERDKTNCQGILDADKELFAAAAALIERGQRLGQFAPGDADAMSILLFATIQGLAMFNLAFGDDFKMPSLALLTAFLHQQDASTPAQDTSTPALDQCHD